MTHKLNIVYYKHTSPGGSRVQLSDAPVGVALCHLFTDPCGDVSTFIASDQLQQAHLSKIHEPDEMQTAIWRTWGNLNLQSSTSFTMTTSLYVFFSWLI